MASPRSRFLSTKEGCVPAPVKRLDGGGTRHLLVSELMRPGLAAWKIDDIDRKLPVLVELFMSIGDGAVRAQVDNSQNWSTTDLGEFIGLLTYGALI